MNVKRILPGVVMLLVVSATSCKKKIIDIAPPPVVANAYHNPLGPLGADPGAMLANGTYYFYFTSGNGTGAMPIKWTPDLYNWTDNGARIFPLGQFPTWVSGGSYWAPEVFLINGKYVCYFAAIGTDGKFKIGIATAPAPAGHLLTKEAPWFLTQILV